MVKLRLSDLAWTKRRFNSNSKKDLLEYKFFLDNNKWIENCPFELEYPYLSIPDMIRCKLIENYFDKMLKSAK